MRIGAAGSAASRESAEAGSLGYDQSEQQEDQSAAWLSSACRNANLTGWEHCGAGSPSLEEIVQLPRNLEGTE